MFSLPRTKKFTLFIPTFLWIVDFHVNWYYAGHLPAFKHPMNILTATLHTVAFPSADTILPLYPVQLFLLFSASAYFLHLITGDFFGSDLP